MRAIMSDLTTPPTVFTVDGDLVGPEVTRLAERLWPHLLTAPAVTLLDLGEAMNVDAAGVDLLAAAHVYAVHRGLALRLINLTPAVITVLQATGVNSLLVHSTRTASAAAAALMPATRPAAVTGTN